MSRYAWIIDKDHLFEPGDVIDNEAGITGPRDAPAILLGLLNDGKGREFRMYDGDGELYYSGRILVADSDGSFVEGTDSDFGPLNDFGVGNAGCTDIRYMHRSSWTTL